MWGVFKLVSQSNRRSPVQYVYLCVRVNLCWGHTSRLASLWPDGSDLQILDSGLALLLLAYQVIDVYVMKMIYMIIVNDYVIGVMSFTYLRRWWFLRGWFIIIFMCFTERVISHHVYEYMCFCLSIWFLTTLIHSFISLPEIIHCIFTSIISHYWSCHNCLWFQCQNYRLWCRDKFRSDTRWGRANLARSIGV